VVGGGGYGKTSLAAELGEVLGVPAITAVLDQAETSADLLVVRLRADAARLGLSDVTGTMDRAGHDDAHARLRGLVDGLEGQPALLLVDEIQNAATDAVELLTTAAGWLGDAQRLLLVGRQPPAGLDELIDSESTQTLGTADLALTESELGQLCQAGFGMRLTPAHAAELHAATGGWFAAVVLLATAESTVSRTRAGRRDRDGETVLRSLVDDILGRLPRSHQIALAQVSHLPMLDDDLVAAATGFPGLLAEARRAGLPLSEGPAPWCQLIGPVRDLLMRRGPTQPEVIVRGAQRYAARGEPSLGADVLLSAGQPEAAAELLASLTPQQIELVDVAELANLVDRLPDAAIARHPRLLLNFAHQCAPGAVTRLRSAVLERAHELVDPAIDPALSREIGAEVARDLVWQDRQAEAETLATMLLAQTGIGEELTRARLLETLGRAAAYQKDDVHLGYAEERLEIAARTYRKHEQWTWLSTLMGPIAMWVHNPRGEFDQALQCMEESLALVPHHRINRGVILTFRAELLADIGRFEESSDSLVEVEEIAESTRDRRLRAYIEWVRAYVASLHGDVDGTVRAIKAVEEDATDWFDQSGCMFLAMAADYLDRAGLSDESQRYLDRALVHPQLDDPALGRVQAAVLARNGDPDDAEKALLAWLAAPWFEPKDKWRVTLLQAHVAAKRGDSDVVELAVEAFALAARMGYPQLPLIQERRVAQDLLALAADQKALIALDLDVTTAPIVISLLGRFQVTQAGRVVEIPPGQGRQLLKLVGSAGGNLPVDQVIEQLWPDVDYEVGANRLRTVLNRLRESDVDLLIRDDRVLRLAPQVQTDAHRFEEAARRATSLAAARSPRALTVARSALATYRGDLLPDDPYEPWATMPRERLRRHALSLLDICADAVAAIGDLDEAVRCLARAIDLAPYEEERYVAVARHLLSQGRRGAARSYVDRARAVLQELNLSPPAELVELDRRVRRL
jgi:DNA-binding SARP family transcriptional activator/ATP/maltotriose-dependent transcriptional regulator MalT